MTSIERNWAGNYEYRATEIHRPGPISELQSIVERAPRVRVLGSRHSFTDIVDSDALLDLSGLDPVADIDRAAASITVSGQLRYGEVVDALRPAGLALHNLASLPHISVAGAVATATHGSGERLGNLATAVSAVELLTSSGDLVQLDRGHPDFAGAVVSLGALGVVTKLTLDLVAAYEVGQHVYEGLDADVLADSFDAIAESAYSVSVFTSYGPVAEQVWLKRRMDDPVAPSDFFGATPVSTKRHPVPSMPAESCTEQFGVAGLWADRLPHFQLDHSPSAGNEIQSEFFVAREHAAAAIRALHALAAELGDKFTQAMMISEIRTVAADDLWMSAQFERPSIAFHFTWHPDQGAADRAAAAVQAALAPFGVRPHWGKVFDASTFSPADAYSRCADFIDLVDRFDQRGAFRNTWFERTFA